MVNYKGVFIDDDEEDARIASRLSFDLDEGSVKFDFQPLDHSMEDQASAIFQLSPDIVALDYRLDEKSSYRYKAGPLAQHLRDHCIQAPSEDFPIVLISHEQNIKDFYEPDLTAHDLFDLKYGKKEISNNRDRVCKELLSIIISYKAILRLWDEDNRLGLILDARPEQMMLLGQDIDSINNKNAPHQLSRTVYRWIIERQGLLLDEKNLFARIGVKSTSPDLNNLIDILDQEKIKYTGIFSDGWPRWWEDRLRVWGGSICESPLGSRTAEERISCLNKSLGLHLEAATSSWREGQTDALFHIACSSCNRPTELEYSVPAYDPIAYKFIQRKAICWNCVQTGMFEEHGLSIDESGIYIAEKLTTGKIKKQKN